LLPRDEELPPFFQNTASKTQQRADQSLPYAGRMAAQQGEVITFFSRSSRVWWLERLADRDKELWSSWSLMSKSTQLLRATGDHVIQNGVQVMPFLGCVGTWCSCVRGPTISDLV